MYIMRFDVDTFCLVLHRNKNKHNNNNNEMEEKKSTTYRSICIYAQTSCWLS